jgi:hypothetical protein
MIVEPFRTYHLHVLVAQGVQSSQVQQVSHLPASYASVARLPGIAMTVRDGDRILLCGGILPTAPKMGVLWAVLSERAGGRMVWLHRAVQRFIELEPLRRLEATVEEGFPAGCRWLELLGFEHEGPMPGYGTNGETHIRYGKVRKDLF